MEANLDVEAATKEVKSSETQKQEGVTPSTITQIQIDAQGIDAPTDGLIV